jgi:tRNA A37 threonylcarbamoyladenosine modification protein TsaB
MLVVATSSWKESFTAEGRRGSGALLGFLRDTFKAHSLLPSDIQTVIFNRGPGSFTGIKLGVVMAHTLGLDPQVQILSFTTFDRMYLVSGLQQKAVFAIDAYQGDFFCGFFESGQLIFSLRSKAEVQEYDPVFYYGREREAVKGWTQIKEFLPEQFYLLEDHQLLRAETDPLYLKKSTAEIKRDRDKDIQQS